MSLNIGDILKDNAGSIISTGLDIATAKYNDRRQLEQQRKLQNLQIAGQEQLGKFNQGLALDTWEKTNYAAQRKQMEKAGLNVGLMYEGGGQGGTTQGGSAGSVTGGQAPQGNPVGMGLDRMMLQAQMKLVEAQTKKTEAETVKTAGVDTQAVTTGIQQMLQNTTNAAVQNELMQYDKQLKEIETNIQGKSQQEIINQIATTTQKLQAETEKAKNEGKISTETANDIVKQVKQNTIEQQLRMSAIKTGIIKTEMDTAETKAKIGRIATEITTMLETLRQGQQKIGQEGQRITQEQEKILLQKIQTEFNTSTPREIQQWTDILKDLISMGAAAVPK